MQTFEEKLFTNIPLIKKQNVTIKKRIINTVFSLVIYILLNNIPLFGVEQKNKVGYRFSVANNNQNSIFASGRLHVFFASIITNVMFKNKWVILSVGQRKTNIFKTKIRLALEIFISIFSALPKTYNIFSEDDSSQWVVMNHNLFTKLIVFLELLFGSIMYSYLNEFCINYGFSTATRLFLVLDYSQELIEWLVDARFKKLETGLSWYYSVLFTAFFSYIVVLFYDYYYELSIEHLRYKGVNENIPIKYMYCDLNPFYLSSYIKDFLQRGAYILTTVLGIKINNTFIAFLHSRESFFHYYLTQKYNLMLAEILYIFISYPLIMYIWTKLTNNNTPDELVSQILENDRVIKGCRQNKQDMLNKIYKPLHKLMINSLVISVILTLIGQCLPLIGNIDAKGLVINLVVILDIKNQLKKLKLQKSGKYIYYMHSVL